MEEQKYPEPTVGALIFNPKEEIFLMKSHKWKHKWTVPGGHIEVGEKMEDALKREIKEETGLDIHDIEYIGFQEVIFNQEFHEKKHFIFLDFSCKTKTDKVKLDSEGQEHIWVSLEQALELTLVSPTRLFIKEYMKKKSKEVKS